MTILMTYREPPGPQLPLNIIPIIFIFELTSSNEIKIFLIFKILINDYHNYNFSIISLGKMIISIIFTVHIYI